MNPTILFTYLKIILSQCFKFSATISSIQTHQLYIKVTRSVKSGINLTNSQSLAPNSDTCTSIVADCSLPQLHYATCSLPPILPIL